LTTLPYLPKTFEIRPLSKQLEYKYLHEVNKLLT